MHQTEKENIAGSWNQRISMDLQNKLEREELTQELLLTREIGDPFVLSTWIKEKI